MPTWPITRLCSQVRAESFGADHWEIGSNLPAALATPGKSDVRTDSGGVEGQSHSRVPAAKASACGRTDTNSERKVLRSSPWARHLLKVRPGHMGYRTYRL